MLTREIIFRPAFDKRSTEPGKNYGIHGVDMTWYVKAAGHAVQFVIYTNWHLPHVQAEQDARLHAQFPHLSCRPSPADLGYHSKRPFYPGQTAMQDCSITGGDCYYDGSTLAADTLFALLVSEGGEAVWKKMEERFWAAWPELVIAVANPPAAGLAEVALD